MYLFIFFILCILSIVSRKTPSKHGLRILAIVFIIIVGFRGDDVDNDYIMYYYSIVFPLKSGIAEISYKWIAEFFYNFFGSTILVFLFYAILGVGLKVYCIKKYTTYFWLSFLIYFATFFILQEMNAMRAGVACGFMLLSVQYWAERKYKMTLFLLAVATFFHYSFIVLIPLSLVIKNTSKGLIYYVVLIPLAYLVYYQVDLSQIVTFFTFSYAQDKFKAYSDEANMTNVFSTVFIVKILLVIFLYIYRKKLQNVYPYFYLFLKLYCIGIFVVIALAKFPAASMRFLDLFIVAEIFLVPLIYFLFPPKLKWIPLFLIFLFSYFYFYLYVDLAKYIRDYYLIFYPKWI